MSSLLAPAMLGLLALGPVIVIMYMLKLKRRPVKVPSTLLWRRSVQDMVANAPFQRLRNNLLMWLQLFALLLLVLALARPVAQLAAGKGQTLILLMDLSASMQTVEADGQTRLQKAKEAALKAVDSLGGDTGFFKFSEPDQMMVLGIADRTIPLQTMTSDKAALRNAITNAVAFDTEANLEDAGYILQEKTVRMTENGPVPIENVRVVLVSDGDLGPSVSSLTDIPNIDYTKIGEATDNLGITSLDVRESFGGTFEYQLFANVYNAGAAAASVFVELSLDGKVVDLKKVDVPPSTTMPVVFTTGEGVTGLATVRLADHNDAFALDDMAQVAISPPTDLKVLLVTRGNSYLRRVFNIDPRITLSEVKPEAYTVQTDYDITVFDNCTTVELPPGKFLFLNSLPPAEVGYKAMPEIIDRPAIIDWNRVHPLTRYANFEKVLIGSAQGFTPPPGAVAIVQSLKTDLISLSETDTRSVIVIGFDIFKSYWPLDVSFPIFFSNLIDYWSRSGTGTQKPAYKAGETIPLLPPREATTAEVVMPRGRKVPFAIEGQRTFYFTDTRDAGVYSITFDKGVKRDVAVNLASMLESHIAPAEELAVGGRTLKATAGEVKTRRELWPLVALFALVLLSIEWFIYCKRTFM